MKSEEEIRKRIEMYRNKKGTLKDARFDMIIAAGIHELEWVLR
jgi:hypothetical protein